MHKKQHKKAEHSAGKFGSRQNVFCGKFEMPVIDWSQIETYEMDCLGKGENSEKNQIISQTEKFQMADTPRMCFDGTFTGNVIQYGRCTGV